MDIQICGVPKCRKWVFLSGKATSVRRSRLAASTFERFPRIAKRIECEKRRDGHSKTRGHPLQFLERRCIPSALNQTQKINRHAYHFCKSLLALVHVGANLPNPPAELLAQFTQSVSCTRRKSGVISFRVPPNEITG